MGKIKLRTPSPTRRKPAVINLYTHEISDAHTSAHTAGHSAIGEPEFMMAGVSECAGTMLQMFDLMLKNMRDRFSMTKPPLGRVVDLGGFMGYLGDVTPRADLLAPGAVEFAIENAVTDLRVVQVVVCDLQGHLPWDVGCLPTFSIENQPVFFPHPARMMKQ